MNRVQSSRRLEREAGRNVEAMWLLGRLAPDHKTIADFHKDNGLALRKVCTRFVELCREMGLLTPSMAASSKPSTTATGPYAKRSDLIFREKAHSGPPKLPLGNLLPFGANVNCTFLQRLPAVVLAPAPVSRRCGKSGSSNVA